MEAPTTEFSFDVDNIVKGSYGVFIGHVREKVETWCTPATVDVPPVLPQGDANMNPNEWFYIDLLSGNSSVRLFIRMDNLYLVGFRTTAGVWWEFNNEKNQHHIPYDGVNWLGFGGSYRDLVGHKPLDTIPVGRAQMSFAVFELAKYQATTENISEEEYGAPKTKTMLASLLIMLCEGLRFLTVSRTVDDKFEEEKKEAEPSITPQEATDLKYWGKISDAVLTNDFSHVKEATEIENRAVAKKIVALIKHKKTTDEREDDL